MDVLEKIAKACSDVFALWNLNLNFFLLLDGFLKSFHAQADLAIFDTDDFDLNFITYIQDIFWEFDTFLADLVRKVRLPDVQMHRSSGGILRFR